MLKRNAVQIRPTFKTADLSLLLRSNILYEQKAVLTDWVKFLKALSLRTYRFIRLIKKLVSLTIILLLSLGLVFSTQAGTSYSSGRSVSSWEKIRENKNGTFEITTRLEAVEGPEFNWPVRGEISQGYSRFHKGIDVPNPYNQAVKPAAKGVVESIFNEAYGRGKTVVVRHIDGFKSFYAHLNKTLVRPNEEVTNESEIGTVGLTGRTTGSHLHLEVEKDGRKINPVVVLPQF